MSEKPFSASGPYPTREPIDYREGQIIFTKSEVINILKVMKSMQRMLQAKID